MNVATEKIVKLSFTSPVHVSSGGFAQESIDATIHSDTLFSAICNAVSLFYGNEGVNNLICCESLSMSSLMPFRYKEFFFPKPIGMKIATSIYEEQKSFKRVRYLSKHILECLINGEDVIEYYDTDRIIQHCLSSEQVSRGDRIYYESEIPRVVIDRLSNSSSIFNFSQIQFSNECGLFFLYKVDDPEIEKIFLTGVKLLGDEGIGADRSVGRGFFTSEIGTIDLRLPEDYNNVLVLSLFNPSNEEIEQINFSNSNFEIITRSGWVSSSGASTLRRKRLRFLSEGSVISLKSNLLPRGRMANVLDKNELPQLSHDVYRNGRLFSIPINPVKL